MGARVLTGIVGTAVAIAAVGAAVLVPLPYFGAAPASIVVAPANEVQERVCPGPVLSLGENAAEATTAVSVGSATIELGNGDASEPDAEILSVPGNPRAQTDGGPVLAIAAPGEDGSRLLSGSQSQRVSTETIAGFAAAACVEAAVDGWLVGGASDLGRTTLVLLANPTDVDAVVDLTIFGENGQVDAPGSTGIVVTPRSQTFVSLAGLAPNLTSTVVHVESRGGRVTATLQQTVIDGIEPGGVDLVPTTALPAPRQVIAGVPIEAGDSSAQIDEHAHGEQTPIVRVLNTRDVPSDVTVTASGVAGPDTDYDVTIEPGTVLDIPLSGLAPGTYMVTIDSTGPVVAAARTAAASDGDAHAHDFAWHTATLPLGTVIPVTIAEGPSPTLQLSNPTATDAEITLVAPDSAEREVTVPAGGAASVSVDAGDEYVIDAPHGLHAAVVYRGIGEIASFALAPPGPRDAPLTVYTR